MDAERQTNFKESETSEVSADPYSNDDNKIQRFDYCKLCMVGLLIIFGGAEAGGLLL